VPKTALKTDTHSGYCSNPAADSRTTTQEEHTRTYKSEAKNSRATNRLAELTSKTVPRVPNPLKLFVIKRLDKMEGK